MVGLSFLSSFIALGSEMDSLCNRLHNRADHGRCIRAFLLVGHLPQRAEIEIKVFVRSVSGHAHVNDI